MLCPITSKSKGYPFEVEVKGIMSLNGVILADQLKSLDWKARNAVFIANAKPETIDDVIELINTLICS